MLRIWTESKVAVVSEDAEFLETLVTHIKNDFEIQIFNSETLKANGFRASQDSLILWDLGTLPNEQLEVFLYENKGVLQTCSLIIVAPNENINLALSLTENGAVDFIVKPVRPTELKARLTLGRRPWVRAMRTTFNFFGSLKVEFTTMEQKILSCFLAHPEFTATRAELNGYIWNDCNVISNSLDVHLFNIRRKIEPTGLLIKFDSEKTAWCLSRKADGVEVEDLNKTLRNSSKSQTRSKS